MTTKLRLLSVKFDTRIEPWELAQFCGAVAAKAGLNTIFFQPLSN